MRLLKWVVGILLVLIAVAWIGGEWLLASQTRKMIDEDPGISAASVAPMRSPTRIGMRLEQVESADLSLPDLSLWVLPWRPSDFHVALPQSFRITQAGAPVAITADTASASAHFAILSRLALAHLQADSGPVTVDGAPMLSHLALRADLTRIGPDAPVPARAAYEVTLDLAGLHLPEESELPPGTLLSAEGPALIWLTDAPGRGILSGGGTDVQFAGIASLRGIRLSLGDLSARLVGRIGADAGGFATGTVLVYTSDAPGFVDLAERLGAIPPRVADLVRAALGNMSQAPLPEGDWPTPEAGEIQLALQMRDGRIFLGPLPLGPAPQLMTP